MTSKEFREKENWNKADFLKGEYDIDINSIDEYAEAYHQEQLKLLGIGDVVGRSEQVVVDCTYCGRKYKDTMCKLHPAKCFKS